MVSSFEDSLAEFGEFPQKNPDTVEWLNRGTFCYISNHPNYGNPVLTATSKSFAVIGSTRFPTGDFGSARQIQFALLLQF